MRLAARLSNVVWNKGRQGFASCRSGIHTEVSISEIAGAMAPALAVYKVLTSVSAQQIHGTGLSHAWALRPCVAQAKLTWLEAS